MESAVVNQMELERKMRIAYGNDLDIIQQLIPYLQHRKQIAIKYFNAYNKSDEYEKNLFDLLEHTNKEISKIIGI